MLQAVQTPVSHHRGFQFPLPTPRLLGDPFPDPGGVRCKKLKAAPLSTTNQGTSATAPTIQNMPPHRQLRNIRRSGVLWENLKIYARENGSVAPPPAHHGIQVPNMNTWSIARLANAHHVAILGLPAAEQQAKAVYGLSGWLSHHFNREREIVVNCEPAVQDEVRTQILVVLDCLLKVRA